MTIIQDLYIHYKRFISTCLCIPWDKIKLPLNRKPWICNYYLIMSDMHDMWWKLENLWSNHLKYMPNENFSFACKRLQSPTKSKQLLFMVGGGKQRKRECGHIDCAHFEVFSTLDNLLNLKSGAYQFSTCSFSWWELNYGNTDRKTQTNYWHPFLGQTENEIFKITENS